MVGDYAHCDVNLVVNAIFLFRKFSDFVDKGSEHIGVIV